MASISPSWSVLELRQYTLKPGRRDALIDVFERCFVESQEALGIDVIGQFRDRRRSDRFVWFRGFADMESRHRALEAFYGGPVWAAHRTEANDTMLDSDDVLLLKPARPDLAPRPAWCDAGRRSSRVESATVLVGACPSGEPIDPALVERFEQRVAPMLQARGIRVEAVLVTESAPNTYTKLPVREGEHVLVWIGTLESRDLPSAELDDLASISGVTGRPASVLELEPTLRSKLGGGAGAARANKHDFDFLRGQWNVRNLRLASRLRQSTEWIEFNAQSDVQLLLDGFGHLEKYRTLRDGRAFEGITLRLFDPSTGEWSIHWADNERARTLLPPMVGRFIGNVGEFRGEETVDCRKVLCRFLWTRSASPRWEQAFSGDGGATWETNWIMTLSRPEKS